MRPVAWLLAVTALVAATAPVRATEVVSIKTKAAEITVEVDDDLKAQPGLFENCVAEAKTWALQARAEAEQVARDTPKSNPAQPPWSYDRSYDLRSVVGRYISVLREDGVFTGGAHPNSRTDTILWDRTTQKRISVRPFLKESADNGPTMTAMAKLVRAAVAAERKVRGASDDEMWLKDIQPSLLKLGPITLAPSTAANKSSGFTFHFSPYAVGSYAEGDYVVFVPWTAFKAYLSPEGAAIFDGDRPESDKDT